MNSVNKFSQYALALMALCVLGQAPSFGQTPAALQAGSNAPFVHVMNIGSEGSGDGQFKYVEDFAWDSSGNLLVTDAVNATVQVFDKNTGEFLSKFGGKGDGYDDGLLMKPEGIAVAPNGDIFVADYDTGYIKKYDSNHNWLKTFSDFGSEPGENMESEFMEISAGRLYMAEAGNSRVDVFDLDGNFKFLFGGEGSEQGKMNRPEASKVDSEGNIWVCDLGNDRVQKWTADGKFISQWGSKGAANGQFNKPTGLAVGPHDQIYVGEVHNYRVQVFDRNFNYITQFGAAGAGKGEFGNIHGVIVDQRGWVYVADTANNRVQVWRPGD